MCTKTNDFISLAVNAHGTKFDYSKVVYVNSKTNIQIICPVHGEYPQNPSSHIKRGCPKCNREEYALSKTSNKDNFLKKSIAKHGSKYGYSKVVYVRSSEKVVITCPVHGDFDQTPNNHYKAGCKACAQDALAAKFKLSLNEFFDQANLVHFNKYTYSQVSYVNTKTPVTITCPEHGNFEQTPSNHLLGQGCPSCNSSKGEAAIENILTVEGLDFKKEYTFPDLKSKANRLYRFDFFIESLNTLIEFDGRQHFEPVNFGGTSDEKAAQLFAKTVSGDNIKNNYAKDQGIRLIRISYKEDLELALRGALEI